MLEMLFANIVEITASVSILIFYCLRDTASAPPVRA